MPIEVFKNTTASRYRMGGFFNVFDDCEPIKWIYTIIFGQIFKLTFGKAIPHVNLLLSSTIVKKIDYNVPIIAHCLRFSSNIEWARFLFLTA